VDLSAQQLGHADPIATADLEQPPTNVNASKNFIDTTAVVGDVLDIPHVPGAAVIGENLTLFLDLSDDLLHKISQCFVYAAIVADGPDTIAGMSPSTDPEEWYLRYFTALRNTGLWIQSVRPQWTTVSSAERGVDVHTAILNVIGGMFGGSAATMGVIKDALTQLTSSTNENSPWFTLFHGATKSFKIPSCQISIVTHDPGQPVTLTILVFALDIEHFDGQLLFFKFQSDQTTFKFARYQQSIDTEGLRNIDTLAGIITDRVGTVGPISRPLR
jgi:hypothetical protein